MRGHAEIVGAGIGGLAAGIALKQEGWTVRIHERAEQLQEVGAGLSIWPNGVRSLRSLGVGELADGQHAWFSDGALRRADGSELASFDPDAIAERYGAPLAALHRGDLQARLLEELGADSVSFGSEVAAESLVADLVVGADGLRSTTRAFVLGDGEPRSSGIVAFRGVASRAGVEIPAGEWWGRGSVAGLLPLPGERVYWYVAFRGPGDAGREELERRASEYADPLPSLVAATPPEDVLRHELFDRPVAKTWSRGAVTLLGDAAHPMLPFLGQGACSALDDAVALGAALSAHTGVPAALRAYEDARVKHTAKLVRGSRSAARLALAGSPVSRAVRNGLMRAVPASARLRQLDSLVGRP